MSFIGIWLITWVNFDESSCKTFVQYSYKHLRVYSQSLSFTSNCNLKHLKRKPSFTCLTHIEQIPSAMK
jgi:hypothetical protein